jgi:hypothetical protein
MDEELVASLDILIPTSTPEFCQLVVTLLTPCPFGVTVSWYCVCQFHVTDEGAVIVKDPVDAPDPLEGADPVPVHPVETYWTPAPPEAGEVTDDDTEVPELYHPAPVAESYADATVNWYWVV